MNQHLPILVLMGPTAVGKTDYALQIAEQWPVEIISVDSAMVYRDLEIGTAKPSSDILERIPHHLLNICDPTDTYSVGQFCQQAKACVKAIRSRGCHPFFVGGTMMYFWSFFKGFSQLPSQNRELRQKIEARAKVVGWDGLHAQLSEVDPVAAENIHPNDKQRIQRALEVFELTGHPLSSLQGQAISCCDEELESPRFFKMMPPARSWLHARIKDRFIQMIGEGFIEEVEALRSRPGMHAELPSMRSVGYRQVWAYLSGQYNQSDMIDRAVAATRQLAKRQCTWLRRWDIPSGMANDSSLLEQLLSSYVEGSV